MVELVNGVLAAYAAAFALGAAHALEVDHMVAVNAFLGNRPRLRTAVGFGVRWGLGHSAAVLVLGGTLAALDITPPKEWNSWLELAVGAFLVGIGVWALRAATRLHVHRPVEHGGHAHLHAHPAEAHPHRHADAAPGRRHRHISTAMGAVHGLAGTAPVVALIPVTLMPGFWGAMTYLAVFGVGTIVAMGSYAALAALAVTRAGRSMRVARGLAWVTGGTSIAVGAWWAARSLGRLASGT
jgi:hypothetical protein